MSERTEINESARLDLLRALAQLEDAVQRENRDAAEGVIDLSTKRPAIAGCWPTHLPLFDCEWNHSPDDMELAMREAAKLGHVEFNALHTANSEPARLIASLHGGREFMVRITPAGHAWITARSLGGAA